MPLPPKVCPECHDEYLHQTTVCIHCDVELVLHDEVPDNPQPSLPDASELVQLRRRAGSSTPPPRKLRWTFMNTSPLP